MVSTTIRLRFDGHSIAYQWRRSVEEYGESGSVRSSHQTVSDYTLRQWFPNNQRSWFLADCKRLEKLLLSSIFDMSHSFFMMWNLQSYPTTVSNERMWHFRGQNILWPILHIYSGQDPNPQDLYAPVAYQRSLWSQWCNPLAAVTLT